MRAHLLIAALMSSAVFAQTPDAGVEATPSAAPEATAPAAASPSEELDTMKGRLDSMEEQYAETKTSVLSMGKLKFSGYVQGQYVNAQNSFGGVSSANAALVRDGFSVRRGRLKATYSGTYSAFVLQIDATGRGVTLKDAEAHLIEPWTGHKLTLIVGQTKWPFGYEVVQSSGDREFPERTRVVGAFAAGERDRGAKLQVKEGFFRATVGVFDGNGTSNTGHTDASGTTSTPFVGLDNDTEKDVVGRLGVDFKWLTGGVSGWWGKSFKPGNYTVDPPDAGKYHDRNRLGVDLQVYADVFPFGATAIKGELITGRTYTSGNVERHGQAAMGWYGLIIQNIGLKNQLGVRYDYFDPFSDAADAPDSRDATKPASTNAIGTLGVVVAHHIDESLKASVAYDWVMTSGGAAGVVDPADNLLTVRLQAKF